MSSSNESPVPSDGFRLHSADGHNRSNEPHLNRSRLLAPSSYPGRRLMEGETRPKRRMRGPQKAPTKKLITIRLSPEVIEHFRAEGPGWQTRIDEALKALVTKK